MLQQAASRLLCHVLLQEYSIKNVAKLQTHWLTIMRQAKTEQLRAEAVVLADISSYLLTRKEDLIQVQLWLTCAMTVAIMTVCARLN